ncbi:MAG: PD-(D/E)XK nuclease family protein [Pseudomonadota bacterium]
MPFNSALIPSTADFWQAAARHILDAHARDLSAIQVVVPTFVHAQYLKEALAEALGCAFIAPRINTISGLLAMQMPSPDAVVVSSDGARLMAMYAELRQHAWLKKLFSAQRNADLLPLAQTLLALSDELTQALLPTVHLTPQAVAQRWHSALQTLTPSGQQLLSDEAQLVWSIWQSQLDVSDARVERFAQLQRFAATAERPLIWISPVEPNSIDTAFLQTYSSYASVLRLGLDWRPGKITPVYAQAWPELHTDNSEQSNEQIIRNDLLSQQFAEIAVPSGVALCEASGLEDEAQQGAQAIINWLAEGKTSLAIVAQDRVTARRIRALLQRAQVWVADETGWKLSTTRAAAGLAAWFDVVATRAETVALFDLLKSPFMLTHLSDKSDQIMVIERALRQANVLGGWEAAQAALFKHPQERQTLKQLAQQAGTFSRRKTLAEWIAATRSTMAVLGMIGALASDAAGAQVLILLSDMAQDCEAENAADSAFHAHAFSFAEWRAFLSLRLEQTPFLAAGEDRRVVMLPLNGARLRKFDAVLLVGADARHLPSQPAESLFFANAVRRELGLVTREFLQREQLQDLTELLSVNPEVVLSWQSHRDGEPNPISPWLERLQLTLEAAGLPTLPVGRIGMAEKNLQSFSTVKPSPSAAVLAPSRLSASGYNSYLACPYQFFASRMLGLSGLDELSDMPQKRDYGDWLHQILNTYHEAIRAGSVENRDLLLGSISAQIFDQELKKNAAALGYYARWKKVIPAYLEWANLREAQGWQFVLGEEWREQPLQWDGGQIMLNGRIDRIDENAEGAFAVLDYKTSAQAVLSNRLKHGEDQQLAFYGLLLDVPVASAHYVALESTKGKIADVEAARYAQWQPALQRHIINNMQAIQQGAAMPANGIESVCQYCEVRGLCRKGAWSIDGAGA